MVILCHSLKMGVQSIRLYNVDGEVFAVLLACSLVSAQTHHHTSVNVLTFNYSCSTCLCWQI